MKQPDENPLLDEILTDQSLEALRHTSLARGLDTQRRARRRRHALRAAMCAGVALLLFLTLSRPKTAQEIARPPSNPTPGVSHLPTTAPKESGIKMLSDEELFALFPGRSLALVGRPGHQQLVFLDEPVGRP